MIVDRIIIRRLEVMEEILKLTKFMKIAKLLLTISIVDLVV